jgi:hypothetical protein
VCCTTFFAPEGTHNLTISRKGVLLTRLELPKGFIVSVHSDDKPNVSQSRGIAVIGDVQLTVVPLWGQNPRCGISDAHWRGGMSADDPNKPEPGETVVLTTVPPGLLDGLPQEDQRAIVAIVGKPVLLVGYDEDGTAELEFDDPFDPQTDRHRHFHKIWVAPKFIVPYRS